MVEPPFSSYLVWSVFPLTLSLTLFVVMLAFWVATPICFPTLPEVDVPVLEAATLVGGAGDLQVAILPDGLCAIRALRVPCSELASKLRDCRRFARRGGVVLRADRRLPYREVIAVAVAARDAGFEFLTFESNLSRVFGARVPEASRGKERRP